MKLRNYALIALAVVSAAAVAQDQVFRPSRTQTFVGIAEDTAKFSPQIDDAYRPQPLRPENPMEIDYYHGSPNDLPLGHVMDVARGVTGPMWPAISATGWTPPDPDIAVGPNHIVAVVNSSIAFFTKAGTNTFQQTSETFFAGLGAGTFQFDPKCFYDKVHGRFVAVFLERQTNPQVSKILLAVSDDSDPAGVWYKYRIEARITVNGTNYWLDYPGFGYNKDAIVLTGNMFGFSSGFEGVQFLIIPTSTVLSGGPATVHYLRDEDGASAQVSEVQDANFDRVFCISRNGSSSMSVYGLTNLATAPTVTKTSVTVPQNSRPTIDAPSTNGQTLDGLDGRVMNAVWRGGRLLTSHTVQSNSRLRVRWYEIATNNWPVSGSPSLVQSGEVAGPTGIHFHMPTVNKNSAGDISMIFTRSSTSITADIMYVGRFESDPAGTMGTPVSLESSAGSNYTQDRWGDYFGVDVDPVDDNTFWGIGMGIAANNGWRTSIFSWNISVPGVLIGPSTLTMERGLLFSGNVASLVDSDDNRAEFRTGQLTTAVDPILARIEGVSPHLNPSGLKVLVESHATSSSVQQRIEMFDYDLSQWVVMDTRNSSAGVDTTVEINVTTNAGRFVGPTGAVAVRLAYNQIAPILQLPWTARVDRCVWTVTP